MGDWLVERKRLQANQSTSPSKAQPKLHSPTIAPQVSQRTHLNHTLTATHLSMLQDEVRRVEESRDMYVIPFHSLH